MPRITLEQLVTGYSQMTPEQINLLRWFYSTFDNQAVGANRHIANVEPLVFQNAIAGSEFLTYDATKLYIGLEFSLSESGGAVHTATPNIVLYNETNAAFYYYYDIIGAYWNGATAAVNYVRTNTLTHKNKYFSRMVVTYHTQLYFNGFRITLN